MAPRTDESNPKAGDAFADDQKEFGSSPPSMDGTSDVYSQPITGNFDQLRELRANYPNLKIPLSIGGWTYSRYCSDASRSSTDDCARQEPERTIEPQEPDTMFSRRNFLRASAATLAAPALVATAVHRASATAATLAIDLQNNTGSNTVYAYVTGQAIDNGNAVFLLRADGQTPYYPTSPASAGSPLQADCAIPLNPSGSSPRRITIPRVAGGRIWFSIDNTLTFRLNPGPAIIEPSVTNLSDPNINTVWDFCELTYNDAVLYANISAVDFVTIPIALTMTTGSGSTQTIRGLPPGGLDTICAGLSAQSAADGQGWNQLIVTSNGQNLRALSPTNGILLNPSLLSGYFNGYLDQVWQKYSTQPLTINTQASWGNVTGQVSNGLLNFPGVGSFAKPSSADIFSCSTGPFNVSSAEMGALTARISAALNRSTLLVDANQPESENPANYYTTSPTNHYARLVHATSLDGRCYAFPYDDVTPTGGTDQSGFVTDGNPTLLSITLSAVHGSGGGGGTTTTPPPPPAGCSAPAWSASTAYTAGAIVSYNGHTWAAKWWTQGDIPGNNSQNVWTDNGPCTGATTTTTTTTTSTTPPPAGGCSAPAWNSGTAYTGGQSVSYNGHTWTAKWWTQGDTPGNNSQNVWTDNGPCTS
jgi:chitodextrinase